MTHTMNTFKKYLQSALMSAVSIVTIGTASIGSIFVGKATVIDELKNELQQIQYHMDTVDKNSAAYRALTATEKDIKDLIDEKEREQKDMDAFAETASEVIENYKANPTDENRRLLLEYYLIAMEREAEIKARSETSKKSEQQNSNIQSEQKENNSNTSNVTTVVKEEQANISTEGDSVDKKEIKAKNTDTIADLSRYLLDSGKESFDRLPEKAKTAVNEALANFTFEEIQSIISFKFSGKHIYIIGRLKSSCLSITNSCLSITDDEQDNNIQSKNTNPSDNEEPSFLDD